LSLAITAATTLVAAGMMILIAGHFPVDRFELHLFADASFNGRLYLCPHARFQCIQPLAPIAAAMASAALFTCVRRRTTLVAAADRRVNATSTNMKVSTSVARFGKRTL
jgi:hypothetical protein